MRPSRVKSRAATLKKKLRFVARRPSPADTSPRRQTASGYRLVRAHRQTIPSLK